MSRDLETYSFASRFNQFDERSLAVDDNFVNWESNSSE
jgi:hypothetical protein